ncbi:MAG: hypothetical protein AAGD25_04560 [Cyanobacteria bacterium P01_F01_bin.150]
MNPINLSQSTTQIMPVNHPNDLPAVLTALSLEKRRPTLVLVGGASKLSPGDFEKVETLFLKVLAPLAQELGLAVVDGGTDAGIMRLIGQARKTIGGTFPLIGVAPLGLVNLPNQPALSGDSAPLEEHHTHCLLIPGDQWGDESPWIATVASTLASGLPSTAILINGGEVTWKDAQSNVEVKRKVVVVDGSGRTADILADAIAGYEVSDQRARPLVDSGFLNSLDLNQSVEHLTAQIRQFFTT